MEQEWSVGDSWLAIRANAQAVAAALSDADGGSFEAVSASQVPQALDRCFRHEGTAVIEVENSVDGEGNPTESECNFTLVIPGLVNGDWLATLSARLETSVYAFEAHDDHGLAIMLADRGTLIRDRYQCPMGDEERDVGAPLDGEP
jgi:hypothetical protein